jgi:hypothetical protein
VKVRASGELSVESGGALDRGELARDVKFYPEPEQARAAVERCSGVLV